MNPRFQAIQIIQQRQPLPPAKQQAGAVEIFGQNVFSAARMQHYLPLEVMQALNRCIEQGAAVDRNIAGSVATAMKTWAMERGATHYTHWFQPLSGLAAQKHESFLELANGQPIEKFSGEELTQREPDDTSFYRGGSRSTFEARGITAWDPGSPAFIFETAYGKTLCIPTIYVSYTGESLDYKIPLLKSISLLEKAALDICHLFDKNIQGVYPTLGAEQEYFLIDRALYELRPDLLLCGRSLLGARVARTEKLSVNYFGSIPERAYAFMNELDTEAYKLGIPIKTRHNEVAPGQYECALSFQELNMAVDHGQILMELIDRIAAKHQLKAILHEKPFAGVNGSAKHTNWSLMTRSGKNLLSPGSNPKENLMFLAFFTAVIQAVYTHAELLQASIATAGNDCRLGGEEAPPSIMSIFIGRQLSQILDEVENPPRKKKNAPMTPYLRLGIKKIPELLLHDTDTNRTSPFAFTGNKFEFRAVGASINSSSPMMILNLIVADQLRRFKRRVERKMARSRKKEAAILDVIRDNISQSNAIRFEGDAFSGDWREEARARGLAIIAHTPEALEAFTSEKSLNLFTENNIFTEAEVRLRKNILLDSYLKQVRAEAEVLEELALSCVLPAALRYQQELLQNLRLSTELNLPENQQDGIRSLASKIQQDLDAIIEQVGRMKSTKNEIDGRGPEHNKSLAYASEVVPYFDQIRRHLDELEGIIPDADWRLPKYRELLFIN
ncbi:MAG: glutamine synthetase type III [Bacteroidetes bacterium]|nr:MAG: glutamine synthetase type III [Bacteroidota bacterium]